MHPAGVAEHLDASRLAGDPVLAQPQEGVAIGLVPVDEPNPRGVVEVAALAGQEEAGGQCHRRPTWLAAVLVDVGRAIGPVWVGLQPEEFGL